MAADILRRPLLPPSYSTGAPLGTYCSVWKRYRDHLHHRHHRHPHFHPHPLQASNKRREHKSLTRSFVQELLVVQNGSVTSDDDTQSNPLLEKSSSLAVLEVNADTIGGENNLTALGKENAYMAAFPSLQVQSLQEQEALASTPAHVEGLYALYGSYFVGNFVEQIWQFAWPSAVALLHHSLLPVAIVSFVSKLLVFVGGPWVGAKMDRFPRVLGFNILSTVQAVAQAISAGAIIYVLKKSASSSSCMSALLAQPWFITLVLMGAIERLTGLACGVAFEWDWVVLLAGANRPIALAEANAMLSRIDLLCEMAATSLYGILLSRYRPITCLVLAASLMLGSLPIQIFLVFCTNKLSKGILDRPKFFKQRKVISQKAFAEKSSDGDDSDFNMLKVGWAQYLAQPALPASIASVFLFFNIGLAPGSLMTSFLTQRGLNPSVIGLFSGTGALMGFGATFFSAALVRRFGLLRAGATGLVFQAVLLAIAVVVYWTSSLANSNSLTFFLALIILSRLGHFTYDIVGGQILQTAVHPSQANTVGTTEISLASLAELLILGVAIVANDVSHFGSLAALSMAAVVGAATLYYRWMRNVPTVLASPDSSCFSDTQEEHLCNCTI